MIHLSNLNWVLAEDYTTVTLFLAHFMNVKDSEVLLRNKLTHFLETNAKGVCIVVEFTLSWQMSSPNTLFTDWITFLTPTGFLLSDSRDAEVYVFSWNIKLLQSGRIKAYDFPIYPKRKSIINDPKRSRAIFGVNSSTIYSLPIIESTLSFIALLIRLIFYKSTPYYLMTHFEPDLTVYEFL